MPLSRWSRRHKRTFGKKKEESKVFLEEHRIPPKPTHYYTKEKGKCRYYGYSYSYVYSFGYSYGYSYS